MTEIKLKKVYVPPVVEDLSLDGEYRLLQSSRWDGKYNLNHTNTSTQTEEEGLTVTREDEYGTAVW